VIIKPSSRLGEVKEYYFSTKLAQILQMQAEGKDVLNLGIGNPDGMPEASVIDELIVQSQKPDVHGYQSYAGIPELKKAIAEWNEWAYGIELDPEKEILPLIGSKEGVTHISLAFLDEGDQVLVPELAYPAYAAVAKMCKAEVITFPLNAEQHYEPEWSFLESLDYSKVKLMWLNYPHMPTGSAASRQTFERLIALARTNGFLICHDNPYSMILPQGKPTSILGLEHAKEVCIELNSLSKSFNMAGWRIGWVAGRPDYIKTILKVKSNVDSGMFKPMMLAAVKALSLRAAWFDALNEVYASRRAIVHQIMDQLGCTYAKDQQGLFVWAKISADEESAEKLVERLLQEHHVFITPGFIFGEKGSRYVRISLCSQEEVLQEALKRIS
jgi:LL-diaminopimelate aminotransferase